uniref:Uncharacterized protein n=1 Tax=Anguilla anguilla TaxID=7936 RepID=A0A0E9XRQ3_ANGAN
MVFWIYFLNPPSFTGKFNSCTIIATGLLLHSYCLTTQQASYLSRRMYKTRTNKCNKQLAVKKDKKYNEDVTYIYINKKKAFWI